MLHINPELYQEPDSSGSWMKPLFLNQLSVGEICLQAMKKIIIVYDCFYDDCDIISVPDNVADNIQEYSQSFLKWLSSDEVTDRYYSVDKDGHICINCETDGFVEWLNKCVCQRSEQAKILLQHVKFDDNYPVVDF